MSQHHKSGLPSSLSNRLSGRLSNNVSLYPLTALALAACGGGGGSGGSPIPGTDPIPTETLTGRVYDGPIDGAQVYFDVDGDGVYSDGDVLVDTTDELGYFTISAEHLAKYGENTPLLVVLDGATDIGNDLDDPSDDIEDLPPGTWQAPAGSSVISPLTDLLVRAELTNARLAELTGLPEDFDVTQDDPYDSDTLDATDLAVIAAAQAVAEVLAELDATGAEVTPDEIIATVERVLSVPPTDFMLANEVNTLAELVDGSTTTARMKVADLVVIDVDTDSAEQSYTLTGEDADLFEVEGDELFLKADVELDYETNSSLDVTITVDGTDLTQDFALDVTNVASAPVLSMSGSQTLDLDEGTVTTETATGYSFSAIDEEDGDVVTLSVDDDRFSIDDDGMLNINPDAVFDFETQNPVTLTITATDDSDEALTDTQTIEITFGDVDGDPVITPGVGDTQTLMLNEGRVRDDLTDAARETGYTFTAAYNDGNADVPATLSVEDDRFEIVGGALRVKANAVFDYEDPANPSGVVTVFIVAVDANGLPTRTSVDFTITDVTESPLTFASVVDSLAENADTSTAQKLADVSYDPDPMLIDGVTVPESATYMGGTAVLDGDGNPVMASALFEIRGTAANPELWLKADALLDYEFFDPNAETKGYTVPLEVLTANSALTMDFTLVVTNVEDAPTGVQLANVNRNLRESTDTSDPENPVKIADVVVDDVDTSSRDYTFTLSGADADLFEIIIDPTATQLHEGVGLYLIAGTVLTANDALDVTVMVTLADGTVFEAQYSTIVIDELFFAATAEADTFDGTTTETTVSYAGSDAAVTVDLSDGAVETGGWAEGDTLTSIENLIGSDYDDTLTGDDNDNVITGGDGNDQLFGGAGTDRLFGGAGNDVLDGGLFGPDTLDGGDNSVTTESDTYVLHLSKQGWDRVPRFIGDDKIRIYLSQDDIDTINAAGNHSQRLNKLYELTDIDISLVELVIIALTDEDTGLDSGQTYTTISATRIVHNGGTDGDTSDDRVIMVLEGRFGADGTRRTARELIFADFELVAAELPTALAFENAATILAGDTDTTNRVKLADLTATYEEVDGNGDTIVVDVSADQTYFLSGEDADLFEVIGAELFLKAGVELDFETNPSLDVTIMVADVNLLVTYNLSIAKEILFTATAAADTFDGTLYEEATVSYASSDTGVTVDLSDSAAESGGWAEGDVLANIENLIGSDYDDILTGDNNVNVIEGGEGGDELVGGAGDDTLRGGGGDDVLLGGAGADTIDGGNEFDIASYASSDAGVRVSLQSIVDVDGAAWQVNLAANAGIALTKVTIAEPGGHVIPSDDDTANHYVIARDANGDGVWEVETRDSLTSLADDTYIELGQLNSLGTAWQTAPANDSVVIEVTGTPENPIYNLVVAGANLGGGHATGDTLTSIETLAGSAYDDTLTGDDGDNAIDGGAGDDVIDGGAGDDWLTGGENVDTLRGGRGNDYIEGGFGNDVLDGGTHGFDTLYGEVAYDEELFTLYSFGLLPADTMYDEILAIIAEGDSSSDTYVLRHKATDVDGVPTFDTVAQFNGNDQIRVYLSQTDVTAIEAAADDAAKLAELQARAGLAVIVTPFFGTNLVLGVDSTIPGSGLTAMVLQGYTEALTFADFEVVVDPNPPTAFALRQTLDTIAEGGKATRTKIADLVVDDEDTDSADQVYVLSGEDVDLFVVIGSELFIKAGAVVDFETNGELNVTVGVAGTDMTQTAAVTVTDVDTDPVITVGGTQNTLTENTSSIFERDTGRDITAADIVITLYEGTESQRDETLEPTLSISDSDSVRFRLADDGSLWVREGWTFDFEDPANPGGVITLTVTAIADAPGQPGLFVAKQDVTIQITDAAEGATGTFEVAPDII